ncbi:MAG TPA: signal peptidase I [Fimbriimonas sp.]
MRGVKTVYRHRVAGRFSLDPRRVLLAAGIVGAATLQPYRPVLFVGTSMEPTYRNGSIALAVPFRGRLRRGDIVVFRTPRGPMVKRVAYVAGEGVPQVKVCGEWIDASPYRREKLRDRKQAPFRELPVPSQAVYVLGDNYVTSIDSRQLGFIRLDQIERVVWKPRTPVQNADDRRYFHS